MQQGGKDEGLFSYLNPVLHSNFTQFEMLLWLKLLIFLSKVDVLSVD